MTRAFLLPVISLSLVACITSKSTYISPYDGANRTMLKITGDRFLFEQQLGHSLRHSSGFSHKVKNGYVLFSDSSTQKIPIHVSIKRISSESIRIHVGCSGDWFNTKYELFLSYRDTLIPIPLSGDIELWNVYDAYAKVILRRPKFYDASIVKGFTVYVPRDQNEQLMTSEIHIQSGNAYDVYINIGNGMRDHYFIANDTLFIQKNKASFGNMNLIKFRAPSPN